MKEILLGFQLRVASKSEEQWNSDRRKLYLLREEVTLSLSVHRNVWPSCENEKLLSSLFIDYSADFCSAPNGLSVYNLKESSIVDKPSRYNDAFLIGITVVDEPINTARELKVNRDILDIPYSIEQLLRLGWICLGYDVADQWLTSGLMNCGYESKEKVLLVNRFAHLLNEFHLFNSVDVAIEFSVDCNERVPEHAPFIVYGIWSNGKPSF